MELRRQAFAAEFLHPAQAFEPRRFPLEVRTDPLTEHSARVLTGGPLLPPSDFDLELFARENEPNCPFCAGRLERATPKLLPDVSREGRITEGEAVLFPNLLAYAAHAAVSVYSPRLHFLPLDRMTSRLMADNLATHVAFAAAVMRHDPGARWTSINANHMLPSGSSVFHPHLQGSVDHAATTIQRMLAQVPAARFTEYLALERRLGERSIGDTGRVQWLASFAPIAPAELRAFVPGACSTVDLTPDLIEELGSGIATALNLYAELGYHSFYMAMYGAPPGTDGYPLNLRLACRSNLQPLYRSDATYFERLHWEATVDVVPEDLAGLARERFARL